METISIHKSSRVPRIDGPLKVTGKATYTSDHNLPRQVYAVPVGATIGKGKVKSIDSSAARKMKGVLEVFTRENIGPLYRPPAASGFEFKTDEPRPPFEDDIIRYYGQYIALIVAETFEIAQAAARSVKVSYAAEKPNLEHDLKQEDLKKTDTERGQAEKDFKSAEVRIDETYTTPMEVHNPIELHSTVADWQGEGDDTKLLLYETSQAIHTHRNVIAQVFGLPRDSVQVVTKFLGSGFGGKLWPWTHSTLAAAAARRLRRPVKLVIDRSMAFTNVGHRPHTQQRIQIAADKSGVMKSLMHDYASECSPLEEYKENCGEVSGFLYKLPSVRVTSAVSRRNTSVPTSMRGPGAVPGLFALESAVDELALKLGMDPVELRLKNDTLVDMSSNKPFSSRHFKECLQTGSKNFGWAKRDAKIGSMKDGDEILGWGVAACTWQARKLDAEAIIELQADGRVKVSCGTHDIGTGMYTVLAQVVSEQLGIGIDRITVELGDTKLPAGPLAGGSMATGSVIPALVTTIQTLEKTLASSAAKTPGSPFFGQKPEDLKFEKGALVGPKAKMDFGPLIQKLNMKSVAAHGTSKGDPDDKSKAEFSTKSFGCHFVEVGWRPEIARLRVRRVVTVIDAGRIVNFQPAINQIEGAVVMGVGMAMFEQAEHDKRDGMVVNANLADYVMAVHADCPQMSVEFLDYPDKAFNALGARGVGEIGLAGTAAAISSAVYHATGVRVRELPITIEKLL